MNVVITPWFMYWFTRLDSINELFEFFGVTACLILFFGSILLGVGCGIEETNFLKKWKLGRWYVLLITIVVFCGLGSTLTPTTKEAAAIFLVPAIVNNQEVQKVPDNALKILNKKFEEYLEDINPKETK